MANRIFTILMHIFLNIQLRKLTAAPLTGSPTRVPFSTIFSLRKTAKFDRRKKFLEKELKQVKNIQLVKERELLSYFGR